MLNLLCGSSFGCWFLVCALICFADVCFDEAFGVGLSGLVGLADMVAAVVLCLAFKWYDAFLWLYGWGVVDGCCPLVSEWLMVAAVCSVWPTSGAAMLLRCKGWMAAVICRIAVLLRYASGAVLGILCYQAYCWQLKK
ncbi:hypothetical protein LOK49_LG09G02451 [Camellia lanceoleosa]|uniref:Uncharacterized protein n=1 Tax=Camellia lanceoleosa TaxID=1840588 RepID=A0ACC0GJB4_9ERIC|nr:hypothetical protein LOK49_LG09G02451 [Camellia lanceoleosa]